MPDAVCLRSQANGAFSQLGWCSSRNRAYLVEGVNLILRTRTNDACRTRSRLRAKPLTATQDTASNAGRPTTVLGPERGMGCAGPLGLGGWPQPAPISNVIAAPIAAARAGDLAVRRRTRSVFIGFEVSAGREARRMAASERLRTDAAGHQSNTKRSPRPLRTCLDLQMRGLMRQFAAFSRPRQLFYCLPATTLPSVERQAN